MYYTILYYTIYYILYYTIYYTMYYTIYYTIFRAVQCFHSNVTTASNMVIISIRSPITP